MNIKQVQKAIKLSIRSITKAIQQVPVDKKTMLMSRVNDVLTRHLKGSQELESLKKFQKELEFNLNFIKISHPNLDYTPDPLEEDEQKQKASKQQSPPSDKNAEANKSEPKTHKFSLVNEEGVEIERLRTTDLFDEQLENQKKARTEVEFSNWFDGNADPEQLKRHKELLERQHFKGQFWKDKPKPESFAKAYLQAAIAQKEMNGNRQMPKKDQILEDFTPRKYDKEEGAWEKVKR